MTSPRALGLRSAHNAILVFFMGVRRSFPARVLYGVLDYDGTGIPVVTGHEIQEPSRCYRFVTELCP